MSDTVIQVEDLSKQYRLGQVGTGTLADDLSRLWCRLRGKEDPFLKIGQINDRSKKSDNRNEKSENGNGKSGNRSLLSAFKIPAFDPAELVWALKDINFEVKQGEVLGIIGRNGAGKSTLLKILSRVTTPTTGQVKVKGRIASLLEVGTGFHPDLSGRENIFLNGAILGMRKQEITGKLDEIIEFSGCERYIDTPVKRYSSGMYVRLAFAVAAHLDPEILIVDEVLAVGDAEFQNKCIGKMQDITKSANRTIIFVSHNMAAVRALCHHAAILDQGKLAFLGNTNEVIDLYLAGETETAMLRTWDETSAPGDEVLRLRRVGIRGESQSSDVITLEEDATVCIDYEVRHYHPRVCVSIHVNMQGACAFVGGNASMPHAPGFYRATTTIPARLLNNGVYSLSAFLITNTTDLRVVERDVISFTVDESEKRAEYIGGIMGLVRPRLDWTVENLGKIIQA